MWLTARPTVRCIITPPAITTPPRARAAWRRPRKPGSTLLHRPRLADGVVGADLRLPIGLLFAGKRLEKIERDRRFRFARRPAASCVMRALEPAFIARLEPDHRRLLLRRGHRPFGRRGLA